MPRPSARTLARCETTDEAGTRLLSTTPSPSLSLSMCVCVCIVDEFFHGVKNVVAVSALFLPGKINLLPGDVYRFDTRIYVGKYSGKVEALV